MHSPLAAPSFSIECSSFYLTYSVFAGPDLLLLLEGRRQRETHSAGDVLLCKRLALSRSQVIAHRIRTGMDGAEVALTEPSRAALVPFESGGRFVFRAIWSFFREMPSSSSLVPPPPPPQPSSSFPISTFQLCRFSTSFGSFFSGLFSSPLTDGRRGWILSNLTCHLF